jgi:hypothetical protein
MVSPHGSCLIQRKPGYFITLPALKGHPAKMFTMPFISENYWQLGYVNCLVIIKQFNKET